VAAAAGAESAVALATQGEPPAWAAHARYLAAVAAFCPLAAVLGARRPLERAWQFIVLSLLVVLGLPAVQALVLRPAMPLELHPAWRVFLALLLVVGLANYAATRYAPTCLLVAAGAALMLVDHLPLPAALHGLASRVPAAWRTAAALALAGLGLGLLRAGWPPSRPARQPLDRAWQDFRDAYGALWALRMAERFNAAARANHWPLRLGWSGLYAAAGGPPPAPTPAMRNNLCGMLSKFVGSKWLSERAGEEGSPPP
jgi:hypothetical protein